MALCSNSSTRSLLVEEESANGWPLLLESTTADMKCEYSKQEGYSPSSISKEKGLTHRPLQLIHTQTKLKVVTFINT